MAQHTTTMGRFLKLQKIDMKHKNMLWVMCTAIKKQGVMQLTSPQSCSCSCCRLLTLCWPADSWLTLPLDTPQPCPSLRSSGCCCYRPYPPSYLLKLLWQTKKRVLNRNYFAGAILIKAVISHQASHVKLTQSSTKKFAQNIKRLSL